MTGFDSRDYFLSYSLILLCILFFFGHKKTMMTENEDDVEIGKSVKIPLSESV
jgi:hypothetical protein